jgi:polyisoprenoid-binding protein YceI
MTTRSLIATALSALLVAPALLASPALAADASSPIEWTIDPTHTRVGFTVQHMVVSEVDGEFKQYSGKVLLDEKDPSKSNVELTIQVASIDTGVPDRDKHLRSGDFFDTDKHPTITFKSTKITKAGKGFKIKGDLSIRGVTKSVTLDATLSEAVTNPWGKQVRGAKITGKLNRLDYGVSWNKALDKGGIAVGNEVTIEVKTELNK